MSHHSGLDRLLMSIGKSVFVQYFDAFNNSALSNNDVAEMLPAKYTLKSRQSRTAHARRVIRDGMKVEALELIAESNRVDPDIAKRARVLLNRVAGPP